MNVLALDLSLTSTGVCRYGPDTDGPDAYTWKSKWTGVERLADYRYRLAETLATTPEPYNLVIIEDLPPSTRGNSMNGVAELHGVIRIKCYDVGITPTYIAPASLKLYATGKGNASKEMVLTEAVRRLGYAGASKDEADALWLWQMGMARLGHPDAGVLIQMPVHNRQALDKVQWNVQ